MRLHSAKLISFLVHDKYTFFLYFAHQVIKSIRTRIHTYSGMIVSENDEDRLSWSKGHLIQNRDCLEVDAVKLLLSHSSDWDNCDLY